jgi:hypothetical protein
MQLTFGAGEVFGTLLRDANGNAITNPTPIRVMGLQELSLDMSADLKEYHGTNRFALAVAQGKVKVSGKFKGALINGASLNALFFGAGLTSGTMRSIQADNVGALIPNTPFTVTPTVPNTGTWAEDLGVMDQNAVAMTRVASAPATGQYSVAAGIYTFAAADVGRRVFISYAYTFTNAQAKRIALQNLPMGSSPAFKLNYLSRFQGQDCLLVLESVISTKLMLFGSKNDDFSVPEIDFTAQADATGTTLGDIYTRE